MNHQKKRNRIVKMAGLALLTAGILASPFLSLAQSEGAAAHPVIHGLTAPTMLSVNQEGTWTVNASDPANGPLSYAVDWGDAPKMLGMARLAAPIFVQSATFTHAYAAAGVYQVKFTVMNGAGLTAGTSATVFVNNEQGKSLVISNATSTVLGSTRVKLTWDTNLRAQSSVWIGTSTPVNTSVDANIVRKVRIFHHVIVLRNLAPGTTYFVVVGSEDRKGDRVMSSEMSFATPPLPSPAPTIVSVTGPTSTVAGAEGTWTVNASDPQNGPLSYAVDWGDAPSGRMLLMAATTPVFVQSSTFTHVYANPGTYTITFTVMNGAGLKATATTSVEVSPAPQNPPVLSNLMATSTVFDQAGITWTTDVAADSTVWFSTSTPIDTATAAVVTDGTLVTDHKVALTDLNASTTYFFVVASKDASGNEVTSTESSFTTPAEATTTATTTTP